MSKVVLYGASGAIGSAIAAGLVRRGHGVTGMTCSGAANAPGVRTVTGDAANAAEIAQLARGADAVISAIGPRHDGSDSLDMLMHVSRALVEGLRQAGVERLIVVGGAGSLRQGGARHLDNPHFPAEYKPLALAHAQTHDTSSRSPTLTGSTHPPLSSSSPANGPARSGSAATSC